MTKNKLDPELVAILFFRAVFALVMVACTVALLGLLVGWW